MENTPPAPAARALMPDLLRAFALLGIAVVNVVGFAQPLSSGFYGTGLASGSDRLAFGAMASLFLMKSYPLFAMMFGAGLAWQLAAANASRADAGMRYYRRMAALVALGVLHFIFFWYGDILIIYGLLGCLFFIMHGLSVKALMRTGAALIVLNTALLLLLAALISAGETHAPEAIAEARNPQNDAAQIRMFTQGSFLEVANWRLSQLPFFLAGAFFQQGIAVFGYFCLGLAAVKAGVIDQPKARIWRVSRWIFLPAGLLGSLWGASLLLEADAMISGQFMLGNAVLMAFSALSALGYVGLIALFSTGPAGKIRNFLARAGSASLSAYLFQSVVFSFLFAGYGFGLFGQMSASQAIFTAMAVGIASLLFTGIWRSFAARGPMEVLLRRITYWGRA